MVGSRPYRVLAAMLLLNGVLAALLSVVLSGDPPQLTATIAAVGLVALALVVWLLGERTGDWVLDAGLLTATLILVASILVIDSPEWQVFIGFPVMGYAVFAAYFRPRRVFLVEIVGMLVVYGGALVVADSIHPMYFMVIALIILAVSATVAVLVDQLREQARTDLLTGVLNRRGMQALAEHIRAFAARTGQPVSVGLIDIDEFKRFNDEHGHLAGDDLLISVARTLVAGLRRTDVVARFGGDEFAVVLPGVDAGHALTVMERIRERGGALWSVGVSEWHPGEPLERSLSRADENLYGSKHAS